MKLVPKRFSRKQNKKNKSDTSAEKQGLFSLEQRIVFDAAAPAAITEFADASSASQYVMPDSDPVADFVAALNEPDLIEAGEARNEIIFIDASIENSQDYVSAVDERAEVILLEPQGDGLLQIADILSTRTRIDALHIISNGTDSTLELGTAHIDPNDLTTSHEAALSVLANVLGDNASIQFYGSDFGTGEQGDAATDVLAQVTGAEINTSIQPIASEVVPPADTAVMVADALAVPGENADTSIVFIDQNVENLDDLMAAIDPQYEVVLIDGTADGVEQISFALEDRSDLAAIHILSHGEEGRLFLGNAVLDSDSMRGEHADELSVVGQALSEDGDILIYGCDFTGGAEGLEAAILLGGMTRADIASSRDGTGHVGRGGDWELEEHYGDVDAESLAVEEWEGLLASPILMAEDTSHTLTAAELGAGNDWTQITVTSLTAPAGASYTLAGVAVSVNDTITRAQIDAGDLVFTPATNGNGAGYSSIGFDASVPTTSVDILAGEPSSWTLNGGYLSQTDQRIADTDLFGPSGTVPTSISVLGTSTTIDAAYLAQGDIYFDGYVAEGSFSAAELSAIDTWVQAGGVMISTNDSTVYDGVSTYFGLPIGGTASSTWAIADDANSIMDGPFGSVGSTGDTFQAAGTISYFNPAGLQPGDLVLSHENGFPDRPTIVLRAHGDGAILFMSDEGPLRTNTSPGTGMSTPNDLLIGNIFAWAIDQSKTPTVPGSVSFDVTPVNDEPVAVDDEIIVIEDTPTVFNPLLNDSDVESDVYLTEFEQPDLGELALEVGESGSLEVDSEGLTVELKRTYTNPVVFVFTTSENNDDDQPDIARVSKVTGNSFDLAIVEPNSGNKHDSTDGKHEVETVSYMVLEAGTWTLADGTVVEVGTREVGTNANKFSQIEFDHKFDSNPAVLSQVQTDNTGIRYNEARQDKVSTTGYSVTNEPADYQSTVDFSNTPESIGYLAIETGTGSWNGMDFEAGITNANITHQTQLLEFTDDLGPEVNFIGQLATFVGSDNAHLDGRELNGEGIAIGIQEDGTSDADFGHTKEVASWLAWGGSGILTAASGTNCSIAAADVDFVYTPADDVNSVSASFSYKIVDSEGAEDIAGVKLIVKPDVDTVTDEMKTPEDTSTTFNVFSNDNFEGPVTLTAVTGATNGTVSFNAAGNVTYTPNEDFSGTETLTYTVTEDDVGTTETGTISLTVEPIADTPLLGYVFDGDNIIYAMDSDDKMPTEQISGDIVFQRGHTDHNMSLMSYAVPGQANQLLVWLEADFVVIYIEGNTYHSKVAADTDIHRLSFTFDSTLPADNLLVYMDGDIIGTHKVTTGAIKAGGGIVFGQEQDGVLSGFVKDEAFDGTLYSADIHEGILTASEIANNSAGNGDILSLDFSRLSNFAVTEGTGAAIEVFDRADVTFPSTLVKYEATLEDNSSIELDLRAALADSDGSEKLTTVVSEIPFGVTLSDGTGNEFTSEFGTTSVDVSSWTLNKIILTPVADSDADITLTFTVTAIETSNGDKASVSSEATFFVKAVADKPDLTTSAETKKQDTIIDLSDNLSGELSDDDGSESLSFQISNIPTGSVISVDDASGEPTAIVPVAGAITITEAQRASLKFLPPEGFYGTIKLDVVAISMEEATGDQLGTATAKSDVGQIVLTITNPPPVVASPIDDRSDADATVITMNASTAFNDPDGDTLTYSVTGLPAGLSIDAATGVISGTIDNSASQSGPYSVTITANDGEGGTVSDTITWTITNPAPTVTAPTADQAGVDDTTVSLDASDAFNDVDADTLTYSVTGLPAGLSIDAATGVISGTIDNSASQSGPYSVTVTANDGEGGTVSDTFTWTITNPAPTVTAPTADQAGVDDTTVSLDASDAFNDVDADTLTYSVTGLPAGLSIDAATGVISGTIDNSASQSGPYSVTITANDGEGGTVSDTFTWTITNPAPTVTAPTADQAGVDDTTVSLDASDAFNDVDADTLTYSVTGLPTGLSIDAATGVISGTIDNSASQSGPYSVTITANDGEGGTVSDTFTWTITNPAPTVTAPTADQAGVDDTTVSLDASDAFNDVDADTLTYSVTGLPAGLSIDAATGVISGTIDNSASQSGPYSVTITANDGEGGTVSDTFTWTITNPAPTVTAPTADQAGVDDTTVSLDASDAFNDVDADTLTYSVTGLPTGLSIDAATGVISGTIDNSASQSGPYSVTITANDGEGGTVSDTFTWTITNPAPTVTAPTADQAGVDDTTVSLDASDAFNDVDADTLTYSVTGLPTGLSIDAATGVISGTIDNSASQSGPYSVTVTANDGEGGEVSDTFTWTITNPAPVAVADVLTTAEDNVVAGNVSVNDSDVDGDDLTYTKTSDPTRGTVSFNANGTFTYTPAANYYGTDSFSYQVSDGEGGTDSATVTITVNSVNDAPVVGSVPNQSHDDGEAITPIAVSSSDIEGDALTYSATGLPTGLAINATTGVISGTIDNSASTGSPYLVNVTVSDGSLTETVSFSWAVSNPAPIAVDDSFTTDEDAAVSGNVLTNDSDPDGDVLVAQTTLVNDAENGSITLSTDGTFTYTPDANYHGSDTFTYQVSDGEGGIDQATVTININAVIDAPLIGYEFNGGDVLYTEDTGDDFPTETLTVDIVYQRDNTADNVGLFSYAVPGQANEFLIYQSGSRIEVWISGQRKYFSLPASLDIHRVTVTFDATQNTNNLSIYSDGTLLGTRSINASLDSGGSLTLGQEQDGYQSAFDSRQELDGTLFSVNVYDGILSQAEIADESAGSGDIIALDFSTMNNNVVTGDPASAITTFNRGNVIYPNEIVPYEATIEDFNSLILDLRTAVANNSTSETLTTVISSVPIGIELSDGTGNTFTSALGDTSVDISNWTMENIVLTPIADSDADITLTIESTTEEPSTGETATTVSQVTFLVKATADVPTLSTSNETSIQNSTIDLSDNIVGALSDTDGSETLSYTISNIMAGSVLSVSDGAGGTTTLTPVAGEVTITEAQRASLKYTPPPNVLGTLTLYVVATATESASGDQVDDKTADSTKENIVLTLTNSIPIVTSPISDQADVDAANISLNASAAFTDLDGGTLTYSASGLPAGLAINSSTGLISGTVDNSASQTGPYSVTVTVEDDDGGTVSDTFTWTITNPAPTVTAPTADQAGVDDTTVSLDASDAFNDVDADTLTYSVTGLPAGLSIDAATGVISGTIDNSASQSGPYSVTVTANDGEGGTVSDTFTWTITNPAPTVTAPTADQAGVDDTTVSLDASDAFNDIDADTLTYSVTGLPTGLSIDAATGVISGTIDNSASQSGPYSVTVTANDGEGGTVSDTFTWTITNPAPTVTAPTADQAGVDDTTVSLDASDAFNDVDADTLTYSVTGLPAGLSIDAATGVISGTIDNSASQSGPYSVTVTANDGEGGTVSDTFTWTITNPAPTVTAPTADQAGVDDTTVSLDASDAFNDVDADTLTYSVTGLPAGLSIDAATGVISGTIDNSASQSGPYSVTITANDGEGGTVSDTITWTITNPAPTVTAPTADQAGVDDTTVSLDASDAFNDVDADTLTYSVTGLPAGLSIDAATGVISGTIDNSASQSGPYSVTVTANDGEGGTVSDTFTWTITNPAPTVTAPTADQAGVDDTTVSLDASDAFNDVDADTLTYSVTGLPAGLSIDAATGVISGTIDNSASQSGPYSVTITANDGEGGTVSDTFTWTITNPAPTVTAPTADQAGVDDTTVSLDASDAFNDVDADTLTYSVTGLPAGLSIDAATGVISGTIDNSASQSGPYSVTVTANDGEGGTVSDTFTWTITNPAPTVTAPIADQAGVDDTTVSLDASDAFNDIDADTLTYSVTGLPAGLSIDAATGVISGTIDNSASQSGPYSVTVTANDGEGGTVSDTFTWTITNPAPTVTAPTADQAGVDDTTVSLDASDAFNDVDADTLTYSVTGLPTGLSIDAATGVISGTIDNSASQSGPYSVTITANDGEGGTVSDTFTWTITNPAPTVTAPTADQAGVDDTTVSLDASDAFNDVDADTLTYSVTGLPAGLSIDAATGVISGTIDNSASQSGPYSVTVTANDGEGGTVSDTFTWTITNPAPTVTAPIADQAGVDDTTVSLDASDAFNDIDADTLTYSVTGLPAGLSIDAATGVISGTIDNSASQSGPYSVTVTANDGEGGTVSDTFTWTITNPAPTVTAPTADQAGVDDTTVSLDASDAFNDVDADTLTYSVTGLPAGLSIDAATGVISGTIDNSASQSGPYSVTVTANDGEGGTVSDTFTWTITNPAPTVTAPTADQAGVDDTTVSLDASDAFNDVDADTLTYSVTGLPAGLSIDAATGVISGTIDNSASQSGPYSVTVTANDGEGGTVSDTFTWTITNPAPTVTAPTADQAGVDDTTVSLDASDAFNDIDADTLTYSVTGLPAGLSIDAATGVISGTIDNSASQSGPYSVTVTANDGEGGEVSDTFTWTITNPAPTVTAPTADQAGVDDTTVSLDASDAFNDIDADTLTYSVTGLPTGLSIDATTGVISGTIDNSASQSGPYSVTVTANDGEGGEVSDTFTWTITNPAPTVTAPTADQAGVDDTTVSLDASDAFNDIDADTLTYSVTGLPTGLSIDAATGVISGTIDNSASQSGPYSVTVTANDGEGGEVSDTFTWTITNPAPTVTAPIADHAGVDDTTVSLDASDAFNDIDADTLTYSVTGLPTGLSIDATTGVISGTIDNSASQSGPYSVTVTANDGEGGTVSDTFTWTITNPAPTVTAPTADQAGVDDTTVSLDASDAFNDVDADTLTYSVTGLPAGLSIDAATGVISGTIDNSASQSGPYSVTVTANDGEGGTVSDTFTWTITNPAPTVTAPTADQAGVDDTTVSLDASDAFNDVDADTLTYSVTGLPAGLSIDAATGVISGTIDNSASQSGPYSVTVTANDGEGGTVSDTFTWTITNPAPTVTAPIADQAGVDDTTVSLDASDAFNDIDADTLTYSVTGLPAGLSIDAATGVISGTIDNSASQSGPYSVTVTANDGEGGTVSDTFTWTITNPAPTVTAPTADQAGVDDTTVSLDASDAFNDVDADTLTYSVTGLPTGLSIDAATGVISGTIDNSASQSGPYSVTVTANDGEGGEVSDTFTWTITNPAPVAVADVLTTAEDNVVAGNVSVNDSDVDGDDLTWSQVTDPANGSVSFNANGTFTYTPTTNFNGTDSFTYQISDGEGGADTATVTITVTAVNDAPVMVTVADQSHDDGQTISPFTVASSDVDGDTLTYSATNLPLGLSIDSASGEISGTIDNSASLNSPWPVEITVSDGELSDTISFAWTVANPTPTAGVDSYTTEEDTAVTGNLLSNDADPDGDDLAAATTLVTNPAHGSVSLASDGTFTYTPASNFHGTDTFTYRISDGEGGVDEATVSIVIESVNDLPSIVAPMAGQFHVDDQDVALATAHVFDDLDGDTLTYSATGLPAGLSIDAATGLISGTIDNSASLAGPYSVTVTAIDGYGGSVANTFGWTVTNPDPIVAAIIANQSNSDSEPINLPVAGSFSDSDHDALTFSATGLPPGLTIDGTTGVISGMLTGSASQGGPAGDGVYTIAIQADDGEGGVASDMFVWTVSNVPPVTGAPLPDVVYDDAQSLSVNAANAFVNSDSDVLTYSATGMPDSLSIDSATGIISGTLDNSDSQSSAYTIEVVASDGEGGEARDTFTLTVNNPRPTVSDPIADRTSNDAEVVSIPTAGAFSDIDGDDLTFTAGGLPAGVSIDPATGVITGTIDGSASQTGPYQITITVDDSEGGTVSDTFTWTVLNPAPVVDTIIIDQTGLDNDAVSLDVSTAFNDLDADTLTYAAIGLPAGLSIDQHSGVILGTIDPGASGDGPTNDGQYVVTVTADDGQGGTISDTFVWNVSDIAPEVVSPLSNLIHQDQQTLSVNTAGAFNDPDGDSLTYLATGLPPGLEINTATGVIFGTIDNSASVTGTYTVIVSASDGTSSVTDTFSWTISNPAPVVTNAMTDQASVDQETVFIDAGQAFGDPDNDVLTYSASGLPAGLAIDTASGAISGTIDHSASQFDPYIVTVTADDGEGGMVTDTFAWEITNPAPVAGDDVNATTEDNAVTGNVLINDGDLDGDALHALTVLVQEPSNGAVSLSASGEYTYTPDPDFYGTDTFLYSVSDGQGGTATASVEIVVTALNDAPVVSQVLEGQTDVDGEAVSINVAAAFSDVDSAALSYSASGLPAGLALDALTGEISGTIDSGASTNAPYTVTILASDGSGGAVSTSFVWNISNPAPDASDDSVSTAEDAAISGNLLDNDTDPDGDILTASATPISFPSNGTVSISSDGKFTYTPNLNFFGTDQFTYGITDNEGGYSEAIVHVTVTADNDAPDVNIEIPDQSYFDADDVSLNVSTNFEDIDGHPLSFAADTLPPGLSLDPVTGIISGVLTSNASQAGPYEVTITATDPFGLTVSDVFLIDVLNRAPVVDSSLTDLSTFDADSITIDTSSAFTDVDGDTLTFSASGLPSGLSIDTQTGIVSGTLESDASVNGIGADGQYEISVTVDDGQGGIISDNFVLQVNNQGPDAVSPISSQEHNEGESVSFSIANNFANPDNDALDCTATGLPAGLTIDSDTGLISGTIDSDASQTGAPYQVTIQVDDGQGGIASQTFEWVVTNPAPVVHTEIDDQDGYDTQSVSLDTSGFFVDPDSDVLSYSATGLPAGLTFNTTTGLISGVIDHSASVGGPYSVTITANDGQGGSVSDTFIWTIDNLDPIVEEQTIESPEDGPIVGTLSSLIDDPDGDTLTTSLHTGPTNGTVEIRDDGTYAYTPDTDFNGTDSFMYQVDDGEGGIIAGVITLNITPQNDAPVTTDTIFDIALEDGQPDVSISAAGIFSDVDGDTLTYSAENLPEGLSIDPESGEISGTVDGSASLIRSYPIIITVTDGNGGTASSEFSVTVNNAAPEANDDVIGAEEDISINIDVLSNDLSPDGDDIKVVVASASNGTVLVNTDGTLTYTPHAEFHGEDTVTYTVSDGQGGSSTATVVVNVAPANDGPVTTGTLPQFNFEDSQSGIYVDTSVIFSDTDNDTLSFSASNLPEGLTIDPETGVISGDVGSSVSAAGPYTIVITADDGNGGTATSQFIIAVANPAPVTVDDASAISEDGVATGNVLDNDSDPDGDWLVVSTDLVVQPTNGIVVLDESGNYTYTPHNDFAGTDSFVYAVTDADGTTSTASVSVTVSAVNDPPVVTSGIEEQTGNINDTISVSVGESFTDIDSAELTFDAVGLPPGLTIDSETGEITGTISTIASTSTPYTVTITASDGTGGSVTTQFNWQIVNRAPTISDQVLETTEDEPFTGDGLAGAVDLDGDTLVVVTMPVVQPEHGSVLINGSGAFTYVPDPEFYGSDQFTYQVIDNRGGAVEVMVFVDVASENDAPELVSTPVSVTAEEGDSVSFSIAEHFVDTDEGSTLIFSADGLPPGLTIDPHSGVISGELPLNASADGPYTVTIIADDGNGGIVTTTFEIDVTQSVQHNFGGLDNQEGENSDIVPPGSNASLGSNLNVEAAGIVGKTVNDIKTLGLNYDIQSDHPVSQIVDEIEQLHQFLHSASAEFGNLVGNWDVQSVSGFSLRSEVLALENGLPDQSVGQINIEGFQFERVLYLQITDALPATEALDTPRYNVTLPDGSNLPSWIDYSAQGLVLLHHPAGVDQITLKIEITLTNETRIEQFISVDILNAQISLLDKSSQEIQTSQIDGTNPTMFAEQTEKEISSLEKDKLFKAMFE